MATLGRSEETERHGDERADLIEVPGARGPEECFQFGEREFDRIEVGAVGRQKSDGGADGGDGGADRRVFVHGEVIEHHHVAGSQRRDQDLFDIGEEGRRVDRPIEHGRRAEPVEPPRGHHRVCLPMAAGRVIVEPLTAWTAAIAPQQIGRHAAFVEQHILTHIAQRLPAAPLPPLRGDIRAALFVRVYRFF